MIDHDIINDVDPAPGQDGGWAAAGSLPAVPPFDFSHSLAFIGAFPPAHGDQHTTPASLEKAFLIDGRAIAVRLTSAGSAAAPALALSLCSPAAITAELQAAITGRVRFYLSLDDDLRPFYAIGEADPAFAPVLALLAGYHQVKFPTPFENAAWAILSQRTRLPAARQTKLALTKTFGQRIAVPGRALWAFPEPAAIAAAPAAELEPLLRNGRKLRYLTAAAAAFADVDEAFLRHGPSAEVAAWLLGIPGLGPWSASFILIRGLGRMDAAPVEAELARAAARWYGPMSSAKLAEIAHRYDPWQGYWAHYLRIALDRRPTDADIAPP